MILVFVFSQAHRYRLPMLLLEPRSLALDAATCRVASHTDEGAHRGPHRQPHLARAAGGGHRRFPRGAEHVGGLTDACAVALCLASLACETRWRVQVGIGTMPELVAAGGASCSVALTLHIDASRKRIAQGLASLVPRATPHQSPRRRGRPASGSADLAAGRMRTPLPALKVLSIWLARRRPPPGSLGAQPGPLRGPGRLRQVVARASPAALRAFVLGPPRERDGASHGLRSVCRQVLHAKRGSELVAVARAGMP